MTAWNGKRVPWRPLSHPNIVAVHDFLRLSDGDAAIVMEAIDAGNLRDELRAAGSSLPTERAIELIRQIAHGLGRPRTRSALSTAT